MRRFFALTDTARMTLHDAGRHVRRLAPLYHPRDARGQVASNDGLRWHADPLDAFVDAVWRATHRPHRTDVLLRASLGRPRISHSGLVALQPPPSVQPAIGRH